MVTRLCRRDTIEPMLLLAVQLDVRGVQVEDDARRRVREVLDEHLEKHLAELVEVADDLLVAAPLGGVLLGALQPTERAGLAKPWPRSLSCRRRSPVGSSLPTSVASSGSELSASWSLRSS